MSLIPDIATLNEHVTQNGNLQYESIAPHLKRAEKKFIEPVLTKALVADLDAYVNGSSSANSDYDDLLAYVQPALANFALMLALPSLSISIDDLGITVHKSDDRVMATLSREDRALQDFEDAGYEWLEYALEHLEENKATFTDWASSDASTVFNECLIKTATEFSRYYPIGGRRSVFVRLKEPLRYVEGSLLKAQLTGDLYNEVKTQANGGNLTTANQHIYDEYIKPAIAHLAIAYGVERLAIRINADGVVLNERDGFSDGYTRQQSVDAGRLEQMRRNVKDTGEHYLQAMREYITNNLSDYPTFEASDDYDSSSSHYEIDHTDLKSGDYGFL